LISQAKETLLRLPEDDKEEKSIVLRVDYQLPKKVMTLPWPPELTFKHRSIFRRDG
jgi:hypothetical protein